MPNHATTHSRDRCGALKNETLNSRKIEKYDCNGYNIYRTRNFNKYGKMCFLIAGYNTMPREEKEKYNIVGIATLFGNVMFGMALIIITGYLITELTENPNIQNYAFWASMIIGTPYLLIKSNSKKYKIKK